MKSSYLAGDPGKARNAVAPNPRQKLLRGL